MPPDSTFEGKHRLVRWSTYLGQYVGDGKPISRTRLNNHLGGGQGVSRVSGWLNGKRGLEADTAWDVGRALRELDVDTNEIEALWAAGFFKDVIRLMQHVAADDENGTTHAGRLFVTLPARMLNFETSLCAGVETVEHGLSDLRMFHTLGSGAPSHTELDSHDAIRRNETISKAYAPELFALYQRAWEMASRGGNPTAPQADGKKFRGDDDMLEIVTDAIIRMKERWVPSLMVVRIWRMGADWAEEIAPSETDFDALPDIFLRGGALRERESMVDTLHAEWAADSMRR